MTEPAATRLQAARLSLGWTQARLIYELQQVAAELGTSLQSRASLAVSVSRWENGKRRVGREHQRLFRAVYRMTDVELGFGDESESSPAVFSGGLAESVSHAERVWRGDLAGTFRPAFSTSDFTAAALRWLLAPPDLPRRVAGSAVGRPHATAVRQMTAAMRAIDNEYGGGYARGSVVRYLHHEVSPLLREGRYDAVTGRDLFSAAAEMTQLAGWMTYDAGHYGLAQHYLVHALRLAAAGGDRALGAEILAAMGQEAVYLGDGLTGVDLARAAGRAARQAGLNALAAEAAVLEAHGHATAGDARACVHALGVAERTLDRADRDRDPQWLGYFDHAYLSARFGHCFRELGQHRQAERFARRSLDMDGAYVRGRMFNLALLASAHAGQGDIESACAVGSEALAMAVELRSARAVGYVTALRRQLLPYAAATPVVSFERAVAAELS